MPVRLSDLFQKDLVSASSADGYGLRQGQKHRPLTLFFYNRFFSGHLSEAGSDKTHSLHSFQPQHEQRFQRTPHHESQLNLHGQLREV